MTLLKGSLVFVAAAGLTALLLWASALGGVQADARSDDWLEQRLAETIVNGDDVLFPAQVDEATLRWCAAETLDQSPEIVLLGSSHGLLVSSAFAKPYRFSNFAISGGGLPDHMVTTEILHTRAKRPRVWTIFVDPWFFDIHLDFLMWRTRPHHLASIEARLASLAPPDFPTVFRDRVAANARPTLQHRYGLDAPLAAIDGYLTRHFTKIVKTSPADHLGTILFSDGAISPAGSRPEPQEAEVRALALRQFAQNRDRHRYGTFATLDERLWVIFEHWIKFLQADGAQVVFILSPYHPAIYERAIASPNNHLVEIEKRVHQIADSLAVPKIGSYNPAKAGIDEALFSDGDHLREAGLARLIGSAMSDAAQRAIPHPGASSAP